MAFDIGNSTTANSNVGSTSQSSSIPLSVETGHKDMIHDIQVDYYGRIVATASADHTVRLFHVVRDKYCNLAVLQGHEGPVWRVSWAHPKYGSILASCGYDRKVIIWQLVPQKNNWLKIVIDELNGSANCVQFAPVDYGLQCIAGSSDGMISHYVFQKGNQQNAWTKQTSFKAHNGGVNGISWCPSVGSGALSTLSKNSMGGATTTSRKFASCGCDHVVKIWQWNFQDSQWNTIATLSGHTDWVRDVAWAPIPGASSHALVASCSEDKNVLIWKERGGKWKQSAQIKFSDRVWSVSWSELGNILAVASGESQVQLFKEGVDGKWHDVSKVNPSK